MRLLLGALLLAALAPAAWGSSRPQVRLVGASPATVAGTGFQARERVVVTLTGGSGRLARAVVTGARGSFVARFARAVPVTGCSQLAIAAVGARGDRAAWKSPARPCGPPPQPIGP